MTTQERSPSLDKEHRKVAIAYLLGRFREATKLKLMNMQQAHAFVLMMDKKEHYNLGTTLDQVIEVYQMLHEIGIIKFRNPEDWGLKDAEKTPS